MVTLRLRDYQQDCIKALQRDFQKHKALLVVAATGTGKTITFLEWLNREQASRAIIIAHRKELVDQPRDKMVQFFPSMYLRSGVVMAGQDDAGADIICATVQTLNANGRLDRILAHGPVTHVVVDEAHHRVASTYVSVLNRLREANPDMLELGVTATPERTDRDGLVQVYPRCAYNLPIQAAIRKGALVPFDALGIGVPINLAGIKETAEGWDREPLGDVLSAENVLEIVYQKWAEFCSNRQTIGFTASVAQAHATAAYFRAHGINAEAADGTTHKRERAAILNRYQSGETQAVFNCLDEKTEILTRRGWVGIDDFDDGDVTAAVDMDSLVVGWEPVSRVIRRPVADGERLVCIKNQTLDIRVTEGHRMAVRVHGRKKWEIKAAGALLEMKEPYTLPLAAHARFDALEPSVVPERYKNVGRRSALRYVYRQRGVPENELEQELDFFARQKQNLKYKRPDELSLFECKFIGLVLADGHVATGGRGIEISQSTRYEKNNRRIIEILKECGFDYGISKSQIRSTNVCKSGGAKIVYRIPMGVLGGQLERRGYFDLTPYLDKDFSNLLFGLNHAQTIALIGGLWLGDGIKNNRPSTGFSSWQIVNTNKTMLDRLQALCVLRGLAANIRPPRDNGPLATKPLYVIGIRARRDVRTNNPGSTSGGNPARIDHAKSDERVWCVTNETGTIITRRNDKVVIMGQCQLWTEGFDAPETGAIMMIAPTKSDLVYVQRLGRGLRIAPGKKSCRVLDFAPLEGRKIITAGDVLGTPLKIREAQEKAEAVGVLTSINVDLLGRAVTIDPDSLVVEVLNLMARSPLPWALDGIYATATLTEKACAALVLPDPQRLESAEGMRGGENWGDGAEALYQYLKRVRLYRVTKERAWSAELIGTFEHLDDAKNEVDSWQANGLGNRRAPWRKNEASSKQLTYLMRLVSEVPESPTMGEASRMISQALTIKAVETAEKRQERAVMNASAQ